MSGNFRLPGLNLCPFIYINKIKGVTIHEFHFKEKKDVAYVCWLVFFFLYSVPADRLVVRMLSQRSPNRLVESDSSRFETWSRHDPFFFTSFIQYLSFSPAN